MLESAGFNAASLRAEKPQVRYSLRANEENIQSRSPEAASNRFKTVGSPVLTQGASRSVQGHYQPVAKQRFSQMRRSPYQKDESGTTGSTGELHKSSSMQLGATK